MRLLVTGADGQLGRALRAIERQGLEISGKGRPALDITDPVALADVLDAVRPDAVINAAAFTNVERAETEIEAAFRVNETGPKLLALAAAAAGIPLIHISTDFVFGGRAGTPYRPEDGTGPINVYGESKLAGEKAVLDADPSALIIRTSWLYRPGSRNFVTTILRLLRERGRVSVVDDQHGSPTSAINLAEMLVAASGRKAADDDISGIRHFADEGVTSRYDFARAIRDEAVAAGLVDAAAEIVPVASSPEGPVKRPTYSALDSSQICSELGIRSMPWRAALAHAFRAGPLLVD